MGDEGSEKVVEGKSDGIENCIKLEKTVVFRPISHPLDFLSHGFGRCIGLFPAGLCAGN